jgi:hypothetical protein
MLVDFALEVGASARLMPKSPIFSNSDDTPGGRRIFAVDQLSRGQVLCHLRRNLIRMPSSHKHRRRLSVPPQLTRTSFCSERSS